MKQWKIAGVVLTVFLLVAFLASSGFAQPKAKGGGKGATGLREALSKQELRNIELLEAAHQGYDQQIRKLVGEGAEINARDADSMTPLIRASLQGFSDTVSLLLSLGADPNAHDVYGVTALMQASWAGHSAIVDMLIAYGADVDAKSTDESRNLRKKGVTALMGAAIGGNVETAQRLVEGGARFNQQDDEGFTALMYATRNGFPKVVRLLVAKGANIELKDRFGRTALTIAAIHGQMDCARLLLAGGADIYSTDINNITAEVYAWSLDNVSIYKLLKGVRAQDAQRRASLRR